MRCRDCRHRAEDHVGLWCTICWVECIPPRQPLEEDEGEPMPPVPKDGQRWRGRTKTAPRYDD